MVLLCLAGITRAKKNPGRMARDGVVSAWIHATPAMAHEHLTPAILASAAVVFALSIDDFVVTQYLSSDASTTTVSMLLYSSARGAPTPALNAIATVNLMITLVTLAAAYLVYRRFAGGDEATSIATLDV